MATLSDGIDRSSPDVSVVSTPGTPTAGGGDGAKAFDEVDLVAADDSITDDIPTLEDDRGLHTLRPVHVDLLRAGAGEQCCIHGDSLIWHFLYIDDSLRSGWARNPNSPFQVLPVVYMVERFLNRLINVLGARARIVFFETDLYSLWNQDPRGKLVREIVRRHLVRNEEKTRVPVDNLASWKSDEWGAYLKYHVPAFLMMAYDISCPPLAILLADCLSLTRVQPVVFLDGIDIRGGRMFGFFVSHMRADADTILRKTKKEKANRKPCSMANKTGKQGLEPSLLSEFEGVSPSFGRLCWSLASALLQQGLNPRMIRLAKIILLASYLQKKLPLSVDFPFASDSLDAAIAKPMLGVEVPFVDALCEQALRLEDDINVDDAKAAPLLESIVHVDLRLARKVVAVAREFGIEGGASSASEIMSVLGIPESSDILPMWEKILDVISGSNVDVRSKMEPLFPLFKGMPPKPDVTAPSAPNPLEPMMSFMSLKGEMNDVLVGSKALQVLSRLSNSPDSDESVLEPEEIEALESWNKEFESKDIRSLNTALASSMMDERDKEKQAQGWKEQQKENKYELKQGQKYAAFMEKYSKQLYGMDREFVVAEQKKERDSKREESASASKEQQQQRGGGGKGKKKGKTSGVFTSSQNKAEQIREANLERRKKEQEDRDRQSQTTELKRMKKAKQLVEFLEHRKKALLPDVAIDARTRVIAYMMIEIFNLHSREWSCVQVADEMRKLYWDFNTLPKDISKTKKPLVLGMLNEIEELLEEGELEQFDPLGSIISVLRAALEHKHLSLNGSARFQLRHTGPGMKRYTGAKPDPRVTGFEPDEWQRSLLDVVDSNSSALVVAPTSAGKTFISFYAMKRVLKEGDDGILVFVCPTNALANQVSADISARYRKNYPRGGRTLWGVTTPKYSQNVDTCQILVAVPENLEKLLMDPTKADWVKRIRYAVFDECHSIQGEDGAIWEHLMVLLECPILALSATISNAVEFNSWLARIHPGCKLIQYPDRYNDLRKHGVYVKTQEEKDEEKREAEELERLRREKEAEDASSIDESSDDDISWEKSEPKKAVEEVEEVVEVEEEEDDDDEYGIKAQIKTQLEQSTSKSQMIATLAGKALTSTSAVAISDGGANRGKRGDAGASTAQQQQQQATAGSHPELVRVHPCAYLSAEDLRNRGEFPPDFVLEPLDALELFEALDSYLSSRGEEETFGLRELFPETFFSKTWFITRAEAKEYAERVKKTLLRLVLSPKTEDIEAVESLFASLRKVKEGRTWSSLPPRALTLLLSEMRSSDYLPAIVFGYERSTLDGWLEEVCLTLETAQRAKEALNQKSIRAQAKKYEKAVKDAKRDRDKEITRKDEEEMRDIEVEYVAPVAEIDPEFSFAGMPRGDFDLDEVIMQTLKVRHYSRDSIFFRALRRGIGLHHRGIPTKNRKLVETLFRMGYLRVIIASDTLAMGVNMPARTCIFAVDSVSLNTLNFRHMSGRAGRRGYDQLGHIVFVGLVPSKIRRLLIAPVPRITGNFPSSPGTLLRTMQLFDRAKGEHRNRILKGVERLYAEPMFLLNRRELAPQMRMYCKVSMEFLRRIGMITNTGSPTGLATIAGHIHETEPSNFIFLALRPLLAQMGSANPSEDEKKDLLLLLSHIFSRVPMHRSHGPAGEKEVSGRIVLEKLYGKTVVPDEVDSLEYRRILLQRSLYRINKRILSLFVSYVKAVGLALDHTEEMRDSKLVSTELPLSKIAVEKQSMSVGGDKSLANLLQATVTPVVARSPFLASLGKGDDFSCVREMVDCVRDDVFVDSELVPVLPYYFDSCVNLNRFVLDFYERQSFRELQQHNGLRGIHAWSHTNEFLVLLKKLSGLTSAVVSDDPIHPLFLFKKLLSETMTDFKERFETESKRLTD